MLFILSSSSSLSYIHSWIADYSIKFDGCATIPEFEREEGLRANLLAKFKLCPSDQCSSCPNAGEYIVDMRDFIEAFQEAKQEANEYVCETASETCEYTCENNPYAYGTSSYNDDANANNGDDANGNNNNNNNNNNGDGDDDYCQYMCMNEQGLGFCDDDDNGEDMNELAECRALNEDNNNNNNNNNNNGYNGNSNYEMYYVGAYCTSSGVYAGTFTDSACTKKAPSGTYEKYNYGYSLPTDPLVTTECMSCMYTSYDDDSSGGVLEMCTDLYEESGKCEKNVKNLSYQDDSGCELIHNIIPRLNSAFSSINRRGPDPSVALAWTFGVLCCFMGAYIYLLHSKVIRQKVNLSSLGFGGGGPEEPKGVSA
jgi:hypothetical protein